MRCLSLLLLAPLVMSCAQASPQSEASRATEDVRLTSAVAADGKNAQVMSEAVAAKSPTAGRQIIYRATLWLRVTSVADADRRIKSLTQQAGGFIAQYREERPPGSQRGGRWTARIPASQFGDYLDAVGQIGFADHRDVQSQDMTEEFVDLGSRLKNKKALEARLLELVAKRGDQIKDVLTLETELSRVREEIERLEGRLRYLSDRVALTTVEIVAYEPLDDAAPPPERKFLAKVAFTFRLSLDHLRQCAEAAALLIVALLPWAIVAGVFFAPIVALACRHLRRPRCVAINAPVT